MSNMWAVRILSGQQAGQVFPLHGGKHRIGRGSSCEVKINSTSVSKEHAAILVTGDKLILTDLNSRNGTFVNGVRVQNQRLDIGDKISLHDVMFDVLRIPDEMHVNNQPLVPQGGMYAAPPPAWAGNAAVQLHQQQTQQQQAGYQDMQAMQMQHAHSMQNNPHAQAAPTAGPQMSAQSVAALFGNFRIYIDNVAMPGVYHLAQSMPFHYAIGAMVAIYAVLVTALSTVPVVNTTKQNIKMESIRRAKTIARNMAALNRQAVVEDKEERMSVRQAELEEGITTAVIIRAKDGTILAPANKRGDFVNKPFVNKARREEKDMAEFIDDSNLGVSIPITVYSPENGNQTVIAYAIVLYDMGSLAINASQTFSLFIETLAISLLVGFVLYFFMMKITEHPIDALNRDLDDALRDGREDITTDYKLPSIERLISNINSALSRIDRSGGAQKVNIVINRDIEASNVLRMIPSAAIAVNAIDERIIGANPAFDRLIGGGVNLAGQPITAIPDVSLQGQFVDMIPKMRASLSEIAMSEIPFAGAKFEINGQAVMAGDEPAYFLIVLNSLENHE
jgi:hypothetical protein